MGCVFGKFSPPRKTDKPKRRNSYGKSGTTKYSSKHVGVKRETQKERVPSNAEKVSGSVVISAEKVLPGVSVVEEERDGEVVIEEEKKEVEVCDAEEKKIARYEYVDGWPKWLVDNIPSDVLATMVPKSADSYEKLAKAGRGTYSNVYKARDKGTGKIVALKKVRFDTTDSESIMFMAREIRILQTLDHPNIMKLEGLATSRMQYSLYLVFDFMQTDLTRIISRPGERLTEPQIKCYMQQLLSGLQHCHERGVMHRDIKASNLLIDKKGVLKIADFGLANSLAVKPEGPLTNRVVTLWYRAPELLLGSTDYGFGIDLWSAGCLLAEMFVGRPIMPGRTEVEQLHMIFKLCGSPSEDYWRKLKLTTSYRPPQHYKPRYEENLRNFPPSSLALLTILLDLDPARRGSAASALQSEFFKSNPLACDPSALPVIVNSKGEDDRLQTKRRKRHKTVKKWQVSQTSHITQSRKKQTAEEPGRDSEASKEKREQKKQGQEPGSSGSSISSGSRLQTNEGQETGNSGGSSSMNASISPVFLFSGKKSPKTEGHPNALKNIKNYSALLQASMMDIMINRNNESNESAQIRRSFSMLDLRLDPEKLSNLYGLSKRI